MNARRAWTWGRARRAYGVILGLALLTLTLAGCSLNLGGSSAAKSSDQTLSALPWCDQPLISFQDYSQASQQALTQWSAVKDQLGFTPYLPTTLPKGSCLDLVGGSIHDPIFGGHLSITWVLPTTGPISFSEAPKRGPVSSTPQCAESAPATTATPGAQSQLNSQSTTICIAALGDASVTIASHMPASVLQAYFSALQPNVDWQPSGPAPTVTPTPTPQA